MRTREHGQTAEHLPSRRGILQKVGKVALVVTAALAFGTFGAALHAASSEGGVPNSPNFGNSSDRGPDNSRAGDLRGGLSDQKPAGLEQYKVPNK